MPTGYLWSIWNVWKENRKIKTQNHISGRCTSIADGWISVSRPRWCDSNKLECDFFWFGRRNWEVCNMKYFKSISVATETRLSPKIFFFLSEKVSYTWWWWKVTDPGFLAFWPFENERKFRRKRRNAAKNLKFGKKWVLTTTCTSPTKPWNVRMYHYHTSYYADHRFPIINTSRFVIHRCEFYLFLNRTVWFICFMTNLSPMRKLSLSRTLRNYNIIESAIASMKRHHIYES